MVIRVVFALIEDCLEDKSSFIFIIMIELVFSNIAVFLCPFCEGVGELLSLITFGGC